MVSLTTNPTVGIICICTLIPLMEMHFQAVSVSVEFFSFFIIQRMVLKASSAQNKIPSLLDLWHRFGMKNTDLQDEFSKN